LAARVAPPVRSPPLGYDLPMESHKRPDLEFDLWAWHTEGNFPKDQPPEQGYVHIGMFLAWLIERDMLNPRWVARAAVQPTIASMREAAVSPCALRDVTDGRLGGDMMTADAAAFAGAYYAPQYGYTQDWRRVFGKAADKYAVPETWETYGRIAPVIDFRYAGWVKSGKPELMDMPGLLGSLLKLWRSRSRSKP